MSCPRLECTPCKEACSPVVACCHEGSKQHANNMMCCRVKSLLDAMLSPRPAAFGWVVLVGTDDTCSKL
eukprot:364766-Chlamydomonas_euryale.AAC.5